jgi:putative tryptophan/tyrosine transport system substrate-binding protein
MKRRDFLGVLGGAALAWPPMTVRAQQANPTIGFLTLVRRDAVSFQTAAFRKGLGEAGFVEGGSVTIDYRFADDRVDRIPALAAELVRSQVKVIAVFTTIAARAVKAATNTIPVVFLTGEDPIAAGLVTSVSRPEGNLTGVTFSSAALGAKRVELLRMLVPRLDLMGVLVDPNSPESVTQARDVQDVARALSQRIIVINVATNAEIDTAFSAMRQQNVSALFACGSPFFNAHRERMTSLAATHRIPGMWPNRNATNAGGLISYGASIPEAYHQVGIYVGRIIKGARPAELPVWQPNKFDLVINLKTARALGLGVPDRLMALADDVIE